jgi:hypothetical protein
LADERIREFCDGGVPEVAEALGIAGTTVKTHLGAVYKKNGGLGSARHERLSEISSLRNVRYHPKERRESGHSRHFAFVHREPGRLDLGQSSVTKTE